MIVVNKKQVSLTPSGRLVTEASSLGLRPGEWPEFVSVVNDEGEGFLFQKGDVTPYRAHYYSTGDQILVVYND